MAITLVAASQGYCLLRCCGGLENIGTTIFTVALVAALTPRMASLIAVQPVRGSGYGFFDPVSQLSISTVARVIIAEVVRLSVGCLPYFLTSRAALLLALLGQQQIR